MFTPQQLFGQVETTGDLLRHMQFLERARLEREREREMASRLALAAYVVARLIDRLVVLQDAEPEDRQGFLWQLESARRYLRELPSNDPEAAHLSGILDAIGDEGERRTPVLRMSLTAYAYFLEHEGRLDEGLEVLGLSARTHGEEIPAADFTAFALFAARLNRLMARWESATAAYNAAIDAATLSGDAISALRAKLGQSGVLRGQGNLPAALALAESVIEEASQRGLPDVQAMGYADVGAVLSRQGRTIEALEALYRAFRLTQDPLTQMRTLGDLACGLSEIGAYDVARTAFEIVITSNTKFVVRANALLELMDLESRVHNRVAFERRRNEARGMAEQMVPSMAIDFRFKTGVGLARFGQMSRAREALMEALELAEAHRLNEWYFRVERVLDEVIDGALVETEPAPAGASETPAVARMAVGLQEYAAMAVS